MSEVRPQEVVRSPSPRVWRRLLDPTGWPGALLIYSLVAGVVCFWRLGSNGLVSMEGMVVDGARHMLDSGDWLVPQVYGELYFYKPALAYWLASLPLRLTDAPSELLLRAPFAACGFFMGLAVLLLVGRQVGWRTGFLSAVASITGVLFFQKSRMMEFDISLTAGVGVAVAATCYNLAAARPRWGVWLLCYLALAVGFLSKGVPALMAFGPGLVAAAVAVKRRGRLFEWRHLTAALLFAAICGFYLWGVWRAAGAEAFQQPLVEARVRGFGRLTESDLEAVPEARRFTGSEDGRNPGWSSYLGRMAFKPVLVWGAFLPWTVLVFFAARRPAGQGGEMRDRLVRCAAGFLVAGTLMLMLVPTQETRYFLPLSVPIGILCGLTADRLIGSAREQRAMGAGFGVVLLIAAAAVALALGLDPTRMLPGSRPILIVSGGLAVLTALHLRRRGGRYQLPLILGVAALCALLLQYLGVEPYRASTRSQRPQAEHLGVHLPPDGPLWVLGPSDEAGKHASLLYYLGRPVRAFRPGTELPATGVHCLLTAANLESLSSIPGFGFREIARQDHRWFSYRLGACYGSAAERAGARDPLAGSPGTWSRSPSCSVRGSG